MRASVRREAAERFASEVHSALGPRFGFARLFGSVARGDDTEASDVDVFLVVDRRDPSLLHVVYGLADKISRDLGVDLSVKVADRRSYEEAKSFSLIRHIENEGVALG